MLPYKDPNGRKGRRALIDGDIVSVGSQGALLPFIL